MSTRVYRLLMGLSLLSALFLSMPYVVYILCAIFLFEGITGWRIPILISHIIDKDKAFPFDQDSLCSTPTSRRYDFESERLFDFVVACLLLLSYVLYPHYLWFLPWFLGFAITGAGVTGICPMVALFRRMGFR